MRAEPSYKTLLTIKLINELGYNLDPGSMIMDFGCGSGRTVGELRAMGYQAFGCDIGFKSDDDVDTESMKDKGVIRLIEASPYRLPFEDNSFDFIFSEQVFEHIQNYSKSVGELKRIIKPDGFCLHIFSSRYRLIEPHIHVPLATIIRSYPWLYFWAMMGIRNKFQKNLSARETAHRNHEFLRNNTNYLSRARIKEQFRIHFDDVTFCEKVFLKKSNRGRYIYALLLRTLPFLAYFYSTFRTRVILTRQPIKVLEMTVI